ncbi:MAG: sigma-70 family RNA polymerase sigma factor [Methylophilus sp.]|nr:sigma-70 family RNA polymerase sigma factor [Methylophilus sp.]
MATSEASIQQEVHSLYRSHHGWLVSWLKRRLGCIQNANDLAQDTFLHVIDKSTSFAQVNEPRALLSTIAHGLMVDHVRRKDLEQAYLQTIAHLPQRLDASPEDRLIFIEALLHIDQLFNGLKPNVRDVFLLSRLEGMTYPEIATKLGVSLRTVESHMAQALRHVLTTQH